MDAKLATFGYVFEPSKYSPALGYSRFKIVISARPTQRFFDVKSLRIPTFDGLAYHLTQVTRHELQPQETFQACLGELSLETFRGEHLRAFSFGGSLQASIQGSDLYCDYTSNAPIFKLQDDPNSAGEVVVEEIMDLLAEMETGLAGHENELYSRLAKHEPYAIFLACLVSLQKRLDSIPMNLRRDRFQKVSSAIHRATNIIKDSDGWDGHSPGLDELISG